MLYIVTRRAKKDYMRSFFMVIEAETKAAALRKAKASQSGIFDPEKDSLPDRIGYHQPSASRYALGEVIGI